MKPPRLTIGRLMALVLGFALNLALLKLAFTDAEFLGEAIVGVLVMANVLAFGGYRLIARRVGTGFDRGFVIAGCLGTITYLVVLAVFPETVTAYMDLVLEPMEVVFKRFVMPAIGGREDGLMMLVIVPFIVAASTFAALPQLLVALLGGWLGSLVSRRAAGDAGR